MEDFKAFLKTKRPTQKKTKVDELSETNEVHTQNVVVEDVIVDKETNPTKKSTPTSVISSAQKILSEDSIPTFTAPKSGFVGSFNYVPEPSLFTEGSEYRNKSNGTVYKKVGNLWEEYIRDGKNGAQGMSVGGGCGVQEVKSLISKHAASKLFLIEEATSTSVSSTVSDLKSFDPSTDFNIVGLKVEGPSTGPYSAVVRFYTYENNQFKLAATSVITNTNNVDGILFLSENKQWSADIQVTSGVVPAPGITAKVVL